MARFEASPANAASTMSQASGLAAEVERLAANENSVSPTRSETNDYLFGRTKRAFDIAGSLALILLFLPVFLWVALLVRLTSPGPALFVQTRNGAFLRTFPILKFRSMYAVPAECAESKQAERQDARVTRVGRYIRRLSLDELPQLWNVLRGEMSLVGPRPHPLSLDAVYAPLIEGYYERYSARPGMTGLAQIRGARGETPTLESMSARIAFDREYVSQASLAYDVRILAGTIREVFFSSSAY